MSDTNIGIGVRQIRSRGGASWQRARTAPDRTEQDEESPGAAKRPPAEPGTGQIVDRTA